MSHIADEYIDLAMRTEGAEDYPIRYERLRGNMRLLHACMGLTTEVGELTDALKKHVFYGKPLDTVNLVEEAGDILWYLAILFAMLGVSFGKVMALNIRKLVKRYPDYFTEARAIDRDVDGERRILEGAHE